MSDEPPATVGVLANPWAGKDVRRLHAPSGHAADSAKIAIVERVVAGAIAGGARRVLIAADVGRIGQRAAKSAIAHQATVGATGSSADAIIEVIDGPGTGSALDTRRAATQLHDLGACPIVALGGDGTCRDVAIGAPDALLVAISTGTNNVFPEMVEATSAGWAAGLVAARSSRDVPARRAKRVVATLHSPDPDRDGRSWPALVEVGVTRSTAVGARAVTDPSSLRLVVAVIAEPASTGLSAVAGRVRPIGRLDTGGVVVELGPGGRRVAVPLVPGSIDQVEITSIRAIGSSPHGEAGDSVQVDGPATLAFDGERDLVVRTGERVTLCVDRLGPWQLDVDAILTAAARERRFDTNGPSRHHDPAEPLVAARPTSAPETHHGH